MTHIDALLNLQKHDSRINQIERELRDIPTRKEEETARLEEHREAVAEAQTALKAKQGDIKQFELEVESRRQKVVKLRQQQMELKTNREFKTMESEIATVQHDISGIEDRELGLMEDVDNAQRWVTEKMAALREEEAAVAADVKVLDARAAELQKEVESERELREAAAREVDPEWLPAYERVVDRLHPALVPLENGICGGCHLKLPPSVVHDLRRGDAVVSCNFCGRLLYC